ncbi:hypothetical protein BH23ACT6_BH23ACT6_27040 [soil metagenome]
MMPSFDATPGLEVPHEADQLRDAVLSAARMLGLKLDIADLPAILEHQQIMLHFAELVADGEGHEPAPVFHP